jgi:hypothetical protein
MTYAEIFTYCKQFPDFHPRRTKIFSAIYKHCKEPHNNDPDSVADAVAKELKLGEYALYLPEPTEYEEILASQELMK